MRFWDTSAIVPLLIDEPPTDAARELVAADPVVVVWWGTYVEASSAISRRQREGSATPEVAAAATAQLDVLQAAWSVVEPSDEVARLACRMLRLHPLRAADSLQLAAAMVAANGDPKSLEMVCLDQRIRQAAALEGFPLLPATA